MPLNIHSQGLTLARSSISIVNVIRHTPENGHVTCRDGIGFDSLPIPKCIAQDRHAQTHSNYEPKFGERKFYSAQSHGLMTPLDHYPSEWRNARVRVLSPFLYLKHALRIMTIPQGPIKPNFVNKYRIAVTRSSAMRDTVGMQELFWEAFLCLWKGLH